ncbi:MAG: galactokinase, partial [Fusobacteriaceae bacterium]
EAMKSLKSGDIEAFGKLMNASHLSLKNDYEVTGFELDSLVEAAWTEPGTIGSRMTGAGFGGCTVSLVQNDKLDSFITNVGKKYFDTTGLKATFYIGNPGDGAKKLGDY